MKVLVISPFVPCPERIGFHYRTTALLRSLAGHDVTLVAFRNVDETVDNKALAALCGKSEVFLRPDVSRWRVALNYFSLTPLVARRFEQREARRAVRRIVESDGVDCIVAEAILVGEYARPFKNVVRILDTHNIEFMRARGRIKTTRRPLRKFIYRLIAGRMKRYERQVFEDFDFGLVCSEVDRKVYESLAPAARVVVIPNSVDTEVYRPTQARARGLRVIFTGTLWYEPNADAARWLAEDIFPLLRLDFPEMELQIVGDRPPGEVRALSARPGVSVIGPVKDLRPYLEQATLFIAPVRTGSGTRQKIIDAMAMGLPVVSTSKGCEGLDIEEGRNACLAETPEEFREKAGRLIRDEHFRARVAREGRRLVEEKYSRRVALEKWAALWPEVEARARNHR